MSRIENQRRLFLELIEQLRPWWRRDPGQPARLAAWLAEHRAGSRDRRLYRELCYTAWRILPWIEDASPDVLVARVARHAERTPATAAFIDAFAAGDADSPSFPPASLLPDWIAAECPAAVEPVQRDALLRRAPMWIRLQTDRPAAVAAELAEAGIDFSRETPWPDAWRLAADANLTNLETYRQGLFEIQDIGSQALLRALPHPPTGHWLDACAGAGGKTLQLARLLGAAGQVTAHDVRGEALRELEQRAARAGLRNVAIERHPDGVFDGVLVDAPCSGSGTWRRSPHLKWTTTPETVKLAAEKQAMILGKFFHHVRSGGLLVYATCSLCRSENEAVADAFRQQYPQFRPLPLRHPATGATLPEGRLALLPADLDSDGFFVAAFRRE